MLFILNLESHLDYLQTLKIGICEFRESKTHKRTFLAMLFLGLQVTRELFEYQIGTIL